MAPDPPEARREDQPGWAAPTLAPSQPATAALPPPGLPAAPPPGSPPSVPASPGWAPTPVQPRSRRWIVVLVAALALTLGAAIAGTVLFIDRTLPPYNAARDFVDDVIHGRTNAASSRLCGDDREHVQRAIDTVRKSFGRDAATITVNLLAVDRDGNRATVDYNVARPHQTTTYGLEMRQEGGAWTACPGAFLP